MSSSLANARGTSLNDTSVLVTVISNSAPLKRLCYATELNDPTLNDYRRLSESGHHLETTPRGTSDNAIGLWATLIHVVSLIVFQLAAAAIDSHPAVQLVNRLTQLSRAAIDLLEGVSGGT